MTGGNVFSRNLVNLVKGSLNSTVYVKETVAKRNEETLEITKLLPVY